MAALKKNPSSRAKLTTGQRKVILARHSLGEGGKKKTKVVVRRKTAVKKAVAKKKTSPLELRKSQKNPIIEPERSAYWESKATFNPSAVYSDGKVHVIYRAIGDSDISVLGYARSDNGYLFDKNSKKIAYYQKGKFAVRKDAVKINYISGGGWGGGCEDPRLTLLSDKVYMLYTAFDGWGSVRIALTSISLDDFIGRRFDWKEPVLISPPGEIHKNWVLFPEKIKGKYAILHSISPHIMIDYFSSLDELDGENFIHSVHQGSSLWSARDRLIRGVGPAPIKTKYGWLVLYHKMEKHDSHRYKLWAMILDLKDPAKILYNSNQPILEPDEWYENEGYKAGVVYACGAVVKPARPDDSSRSGGDELFVYYGGADKVSCVATANLDAFLKELVYSGASKLKSRKS
ncbi:MAG: hypothetical protein UV23_C0005G0010 [Candidatus Nomurabacteria bacterium GW2011_GWF1_42_40]|nr:MAG: hypothetical protein UV23_C0005G0010 [Candidatus Nomurabacteria bacterium GW2011_GWF1_42_40]